MNFIKILFLWIQIFIWIWIHINFPDFSLLSDLGFFPDPNPGCNSKENNFSLPEHDMLLHCCHLHLLSSLSVCTYLFYIFTTFVIP